MTSTARSRYPEPVAPAATSLTAGLVDLIRTKPVTKADLEFMALITLDGIANMLAGRRTEPGEILCRWGEGRAGDAGRLALVMGGCMHILEVDDLHRGSVSHPGAAVIPAVGQACRTSQPRCRSDAWPLSRRSAARRVRH